MTSRQAYVRLLAALDSRMPDSELLGDGTMEELTKRRMRVLNATAQAMIEEIASEELDKHKPVLTKGLGAVIDLNEVTHCQCGLRYPQRPPAGTMRHAEKVLAAEIQKITASVLKNRQINWSDLKQEADSWGKETSEPRPS